MMNSKVMFEPSVSLSNNDSLLVALFVAVVAHVLIILGINFTTPKPEKINRSIDITLVDTPAKKAPKKANFLAQENQIGAGEKKQKPQPPKQQLPSESPSEAKPVKKTQTEVASKPKPTEKVITQKVAEKKIAAVRKPAEEPTEIEEEKEPPAHLSAEALQQQIAQMGTEIRLNQQSADDPKIMSVNSVSAHKYVAAQYIEDWQGKVERTGNLNYPEVASKKDFSATLTMDVGIKADGSIYSIRINQSSGNPALDEAAKNIVRMSAPFAPLPMELLKELDVLVITRVWKFTDQSGMSAR